MKKRSIFSVLFFLITIKASSQFVAGAFPSGSYSSDPHINLTVVSTMSSVQGSIDLNCDGIGDMILSLNKGNTNTDIPNYLYLTVKDTSIKILVDTVNSHYKRVKYYNLNDTINSGSVYNYASDSIYILGSFGGFCQNCIQNSGHYSNLYFSYMKKLANGNFVNGWVKLSYDLFDAYGVGGADVNPITASINQVLTYCVTSGIAEKVDSSKTKVYVYNKLVYINRTGNTIDNSFMFKVLNTNGETVYFDIIKLNAGSYTFSLPDTLINGVYILSIYNDGEKMDRKIVIIN
jgi:hypothetical protein